MVVVGKTKKLTSDNLQIKIIAIENRILNAAG
jgi:hypothetical protein